MGVSAVGDLTTAGDGAVYLRSGATFKALEPATGAVRWSVGLPSSGNSGPPAIADDGTVYVPGAGAVYTIH